MLIHLTYLSILGLPPGDTAALETCRKTPANIASMRGVDALHSTDTETGNPGVGDLDELFGDVSE